MKKTTVKCDIIIPVYNAPEWVKLCVYSLFINTPSEYINKVYLMNDNSNEDTLDCLNNLKEKYGNKIIIETNPENLGFVKNVNKGLSLCEAEMVLLLNTDCIVTKNTIPKLISHIEKNNKIGLICPISSNAANLTLDIYDGFSFSQMNALLEKKFDGMNFDACTVVGNCLMITRNCINECGHLDEIYGTGYGEETDYQFKALSKGFEAKVAIDTYVFHKSEVSFGTSIEKQKKLEINRKIFFERWGEEYTSDLKKYELNNPIEYINKNISEEDKTIKADTLFFLPDIIQNAGGCHVVSDIVNYLVINNINCNILYNNMVSYKEIMLFNPIKAHKIEKVEVKQIVATIWASTFEASKIADIKQVPLINFVQGYETYFENGNIYGSVELSYKMADEILTISNYLKNKLKENFDIESTVISNSINYDLLKHNNDNTNPKTITIILRNSVMKGDFLLLDLLKIMDKRLANVEVNVLYMNKYLEFPKLKNSSVIVNKILGPLSRAEVKKILKKTDIYVDASFNEGFGLTALEAMACGAIPIVSNSFGILDYVEDGVNGYIVDSVNNVERYFDKIEYLLNNNEIYAKIKSKLSTTAQKHDCDNYVNDYIDYFLKPKIIIKKEFDSLELKIIAHNSSSTKSDKKIKKLVYIFAKIVPKSLKRKVKKIISFLNNM